VFAKERGGGLGATQSPPYCCRRFLAWMDGGREGGRKMKGNEGSQGKGGFLGNSFDLHFFLSFFVFFLLLFSTTTRVLLSIFLFLPPFLLPLFFLFHPCL
jgi:hypothetical protein